MKSRLADIADVRLGRQRSPENATGDRMRPYLRAANVKWGGLELSDVNEMAFTEAESETYELRPGDLLLGEASGSPSEVGKPGQYKGEIDGCCFQNTLLRVRLPEGLLPDFYEHYFREQALNGKFAAGSRGVGIHHLGAAALSDWQIPVAPTSEQGRVITAIDEAFSKLDAGEAGLRTVRHLLGRMREAVLAAAVTGRLVHQDPTDIRASKLLGDIGVDSTAIEGNPDGWIGVPLKAILEHTIGGVWGSDPGGDEIDVDVLRVTEMRPDGSLDPTTAARRSIKSSQLASRRLRVGDLLLEKSGGGPTRPVGRVGMVRRVHSASVCANFMQLLRSDARVCLPDFLEIALRQFHFSGKTEPLQTATTNIRNLKMKDYFDTLLLLPPLKEQERIVAEVERQLSFIEACERAVHAGLARSARLRRSVLRAAFEGRLAPQDSSEETASVLLERIRAERAANPGSAGRRRHKKVEAP